MRIIEVFAKNIDSSPQAQMLLDHNETSREVPVCQVICLSRVEVSTLQNQSYI